MISKNTKLYRFLSACFCFGFFGLFVFNCRASQSLCLLSMYTDYKEGYIYSGPCFLNFCDLRTHVEYLAKLLLRESHFGKHCIRIAIQGIGYTASFQI